MTVDEADDLAVRIARTWPTMRVPADEWREVLADLDAGTCGTAFIRLRNDQPRPPAIAEFIQLYRGLATPANMPIREHCTVCGGDGYNTIHQTVQGRDYEAFVACRCANGDVARRTLGEVRSRNDAELGRLFPDRNGRADASPLVAGDERLFDERIRADIA